LSPLTVGTLVVGLLIADLFIAVPTLTVTILAGFFLGFGYGATFAIIGLLMAGCCGYGLSRLFGNRILRTIVRDDAKRQEMVGLFNRHGIAMVLLSRAAPILPEVSACLAGMTRMPFPKFFAAWSISAGPYAFIAAYAGSVSTLEDPNPAIFTALGISGFLWLMWALYRRRHARASSANAK
jgi:uncharacterized membrane protein YdjX (TVP38/TMEM64 family)